MHDSNLDQVVRDGLGAVRAQVDSFCAAQKTRTAELSDKQAEHQARLMELEQKAARRGGPGAADVFGPSLGDQVADGVDQHHDSLTRTKSLRLEGLKFNAAAADPITTSSGRNIVSAGVGSPGVQPMGMQNAFPQRVAQGVSAAEYSRYTGQQGAAAVQAAEGDLKAAMRPDHTVIQQGSIVVAGYTKISRQALSDRAELKQCIDITLARSVNMALDVMLTAGSAAPVFTGLLLLATATTSLIYPALPDAVSEAVAAMQVAGFAPDVVAMGPADWLAVVVARGVTNDSYLSGSYLAPLPTALRGLRVVLSPSITAGTALVIDSSQLELVIVDGFAVEVGYSGDDFLKNVASVLGEVRVIPIFRSVGAAMLVTAKAP